MSVTNKTLSVFGGATIFHAVSTHYEAGSAGAQISWEPASPFNLPSTATVSIVNITSDLGCLSPGSADFTMTAKAGAAVLGTEMNFVTESSTTVTLNFTCTVAQINAFTRRTIEITAIDSGVIVAADYGSGGSISVAFTQATPTATTNVATNTTLSTATLNGSINPTGANSTYPVSYKFQWGLTAAYGNETTLTSGLTGSSATAVSANISGLTGSTTYHYRVVAINTDHTVYGSDMTFLSSEADPVGMAF